MTVMNHQWLVVLDRICDNTGLDYSQSLTRLRRRMNFSFFTQIVRPHLIARSNEQHLSDIVSRWASFCVSEIDTHRKHSREHC